MAFCAKCGAQLGEGMSFCAACGAPAGSGAGGPAAPAPGVAVAPAAGSTAMSSNVVGLLTYVLGFITGIIFLVIEPYKNDKFVRFHAFQSIFFNVAIIVFWIAYSIVGSILGFVAFGFMAVVMGLVGLLISLAILAYWIFLMYKAYSHELYKIPFIGDLAAKQVG
jgi:uncharacterized membrane protein